MLISRIAPTPSGYLHMGNLLSFLKTWLIVRSNAGKLILRIDDLDFLRSKDEYLSDIFDTLSFLGFEYDFGPRTIAELRNEYSQLLRIEHYQSSLDKLKHDGYLYSCTCSRKTISEDNNFGLYPMFCRNKQIPLNRPNAAWRIRLPLDLQLTIKDEIRHDIDTVALSNVMPDFVIRRKDKLPAYQVASLVDDELFDVNFIVRGKDLLESTAAQFYLSKLLDYKFHSTTRFFHHDLIRGEDEQKLSKSAGSYSIFQMRNEGYSKEEILGLLGTYLGFKMREVKSLNWFLDNYEKIVWK